MTDHKPPAIRGHARVTFRAHIALVRTELEQGHTAKAIFERHNTKLGSMSYRQFLRHIEREITGPRDTLPARPLKPALIPPTSPLARPGPPPAAVIQPPDVTASHIPAIGTATDARSDPLRPRTFKHDGQPRQDDLERLVGPDPNSKE